MTITAQSPTETLTVSAVNASVNLIRSAALTQQTLTSQLYPNITISDPGISARVTSLENWTINGTLNGGTIF